MATTTATNPAKFKNIPTGVKGKDDNTKMLLLLETSPRCAQLDWEEAGLQILAFIQHCFNYLYHNHNYDNPNTEHHYYHICTYNYSCSGHQQVEDTPSFPSPAPPSLTNSYHRKLMAETLAFGSQDCPNVSPSGNLSGLGVQNPCPWKISGPRVMCFSIH